MTVDIADAQPGECWCCGSTDNADQLITLGNHPEVAVCLNCAHSLSKRANGIEDRHQGGLAVVARNGLRATRQTVIRHGLHRNPIVGKALRWVGRFTP